MFQINAVDNITTHTFVCNNFFPEIVPFVEKYCTAGQATDNKTAHALCMLGTCGYKHTLRICNTYCFSTVTMVSRTRLTVTLWVRTVPVLLGAEPGGTQTDHRASLLRCGYVQCRSCWVLNLAVLKLTTAPQNVKVNVCTASARPKQKLHTPSVSCTSLRTRRLANVVRNCRNAAVENFFAQSFSADVPVPNLGEICRLGLF
jgi:hypothetical protein